MERKPTPPDDELKPPPPPPPKGPPNRMVGEGDTTPRVDVAAGLKRMVEEMGRCNATLDVAEEAMQVEVTEDFTQLGQLWGVILDADGDVPGHVVCLMLATLKIQNAANPKCYRRADYVDACSYIRFAERLAPR